MIKKQLNILVLFLLAPIVIFANDGKITKQKTIAKAYIVNPDAGIDIFNSYGNIYVTTWNEDKIDISVAIKVTGNNESWVSSRLNSINVDFNALKTLVTAKTVIGKSGNNGKDYTIEINYTIRIPKNGSVKLDNKYGSIMTTDLAARNSITCKYGKVTTGRLTGPSTQITLGYCDNSIFEYLKNGDVNARYSKLNINGFGNLTLDTNYTDVNAIDGDNVKYQTSYGKLAFGKIKNLDGEGNYMEVKIGEISGNLSINAKYSRIEVLAIAANANNVNVECGYTEVILGFSPNYAFNFDVTVKYNGFDYDKDMQMEYKQDSGNPVVFKGFYKKSGSNKVNITSNYGGIRMKKNN